MHRFLNGAGLVLLIVAWVLFATELVFAILGAPIYVISPRLHHFSNAMGWVIATAMIEFVRKHVAQRALGRCTWHDDNSVRCTKPAARKIGGHTTCEKHGYLIECALDALHVEEPRS